MQPSKLPSETFFAWSFIEKIFNAYLPWARHCAKHKARSADGPSPQKQDKQLGE